MKQTLSEQLRLAADIEQAKLEGKPVEWEFKRDDGTWVAPDATQSVGYIVGCPPEYEIRIKPITFPDPPEGREWHNPGNQTAEWFEVSKGWRPLLEGEKLNAGDQARFTYKPDVWDSSGGDFTVIKQHDTLAFRTRAPLPPPTPARVPLTAADVKPGSVFVRKEYAEDGIFYSITCLLSSCVEMHDSGNIFQVDWEELSSGWLIKPTPDSNWQPCSKPAE